MIYTGPLKAPVAKGTEIGRLRVMRGEVRALDIPVYAAEDVGEGSLIRKARDAMFEQGVIWIRKALGRGPA